MKSIYYNVKVFSLDAFEEIRNTKLRISRIIDFIAFFSITVVTLLAVVSDEGNLMKLENNCYLLGALATFLGLATYTFTSNVKHKFLLNFVDKNIERLSVLLSAPVMYFLG